MGDTVITSKSWVGVLNCLILKIDYQLLKIDIFSSTMTHIDSIHCRTHRKRWRWTVHDNMIGRFWARARLADYIASSMQNKALASAAVIAIQHLLMSNSVVHKLQ